MQGTVDLEEFVESHMEEIADWEISFKGLRARNKESEKFPLELKVKAFELENAN